MASDNSSNDVSNLPKNDDEEYEVERILDHRWKRKKREFLVKWKGYTKEHDSWEPEANLRVGADEIVQAYIDEHNLDNKKSRSKSTKKTKKVTQTLAESSGKDTDEGSEKEDGDFVPKKKTKKSTSFSKPGDFSSLTSPQKPSQAKKTDETQSIDKAAARRQNLSNNMRWLADTSDESDNEDAEKDNIEVKIDKGNSVSPTGAKNVPPDSSSDINQSKSSNSDTKQSNGHRTSSSATLSDTSPLKIKDTAKEDLTYSAQGTPQDLPCGSKSIFASKEKKHKKSKKHSRDRQDSPSIVLPKNERKGINFIGVYRDDVSQDLRYIGLDVVTQTRQIYSFKEAFDADSFALCVYLNDRVRFNADGEAKIVDVRPSDRTKPSKN